MSNRNSRLVPVAVIWLLTAFTAYAADHAAKITPLIDPSKLRTLGERGANPRIQKAVYRLEMARKAGQKTEVVAGEAVRRAGYKGQAAKLTADALVRNHQIAERLGCLDAAGTAEMRRGNAATVRRGPYAGDQLSVDHIIPRAVVPELDNVIANLELMPQRMNSRKGAGVTDRQRDLARRLYEAGLVSRRGVEAVGR